MAEQESITEFPVNSESASAREAGHWYILHTYSGFEQRVEQMIRELMRSGQDQGCIHEVVVPTEKVIELKLNRSDITFSSKGEAWPLYNGEIPLTDITWSVGNENVATIKNGTVRAVGPGTTTVYAEYNGQKVSCIIRCNFS